MISFNEFLEKYLTEVVDSDETTNETKSHLGYKDMILEKKNKPCNDGKIDKK